MESMEAVNATTILRDTAGPKPHKTVMRKFDGNPITVASDSKTKGKSAMVETSLSLGCAWKHLQSSSFF